MKTENETKETTAAHEVAWLKSETVVAELAKDCDTCIAPSNFISSAKKQIQQSKMLENYRKLKEFIDS